MNGGTLDEQAELARDSHIATHDAINAIDPPSEDAWLSEAP